MKSICNVTLRRAAWGAGVLVAISISGLLASGCRSFGHRPDGERLARAERSAQWKDGRFENPQPMTSDMLGAMTGSMRSSAQTRPVEPLPVEKVDPARFASAPPSGLRVTWFGHSSALIELDGHRVLTDPVWSERASPFGWAGPERFYPPLLALADLPPLDAVVISHDHYDHLDEATVTALKERTGFFVVPLGVGAHLEYWGVPPERIVELDWWERARVRGLEIVCTPARHASGRTAVWGNASTLWSGFALVAERHRVWYSGDTGLFPALDEIGRRLGPFDLTLIESGAYSRWWPDWHLGPEQAVAAHRMVRGRLMLPVHWGLFNLAYHAWTEPVERVLVAAEAAGARVVVPRPGQSFEPESAPALVRWWPQLPWQTAQEHPVVSSLIE